MFVGLICDLTTSEYIWFVRDSMYCDLSLICPWVEYQDNKTRCGKDIFYINQLTLVVWGAVVALLSDEIRADHLSIAGIDRDWFVRREETQRSMPALVVNSRQQNLKFT